jgi:hypothetical protein
MSKDTDWRDPPENADKGAPVIGPILGSTELQDIYKVVKLSNGELQLTFNGNAPAQLLCVTRSFSPSSVKKFAQDDFDKTINHVRQLIQSGQPELASKYLVRHWQNRHIDMMPSQAAYNVSEIKKLLIESLCWKPAVAQYVAEAPYYAVTDNIVRRARFDSNKLPTIEAYRKHRWTARTVNPHKMNGKPDISVNLEGYHCGCWLNADMPLYKKVADEIGDREPMSPAVYIKQISGTDADYAALHHP